MSALPARAPCGLNKMALPVAVTPPGPVRVLLIEDDPAEAAALTDILTRESGGTYHVAHDARLNDALARAIDFAPDVVLLDLTLPDASALQSLTELQRVAPTAPIVVLTPVGDGSGASAALQRGAHDYVAKGPVDPALLLRTVRYALESHRVRRQLDRMTLELKESHSRLEQMAILDPLTNLLNRRGLQGALSREIELMRRNGTELLAVFVDVDDLAEVNETLGHGVGDVVLQEVAVRLRSRLRPTDSIARLGGDEFMVLLPKARPGEGGRVAERMRLSIAGSRFTVGDRSLAVTASLGVVEVADSCSSIDELLSKSRPVVFLSKRSGKNRVSSEGDRTPADDGRFEVIEALREGRRLRTVKHAIHSLDDERAVGYEFLSRLALPVLNLPEDFFRLALETNLLTTADHHCLRSAIDAAAFLPPSLRRHVNLFPSTLIDIPVEHLIELFPPDREHGTFCIEISEQQILGDPSYLVPAVTKLREAGLSIAIDDVGFGSSCLESLVLLEPEVIKIDKRCVDGIDRRPGNVRALRRLLRVAESLGSEVVAEGIDSRPGLQILRDLGVKYGQGFLWGLPS